jgi:hypothetical protein
MTPFLFTIVPALLTFTIASWPAHATQPALERRSCLGCNG